MAAVIKLKRGTSTPGTSDIASGEVAVDTSAQKLYINDSGTVKEIGGGGGVTSDAQLNTVAGTNAGDSFSGTDAEKNTLFGYNTGTDITTGDANNGFGVEALDTLTTGSWNNAFGWWALRNLETGSGNTAFGQAALEGITTGDNNIAIGRWANTTNTTGSNNITVGYNVNPSSTTVSNEITLGNTSTTKFRVPGLNFSIKDSTATDNYVLTVDANGDAGWEAAAGGTPTAITVADESSDTTCFPLFATAATGDLGPKSGSNLTFNSSTGALAATLLNGGAGDDLSLDFGSVA